MTLPGKPGNGVTEEDLARYKIHDHFVKNTSYLVNY